MSRYTLPDLPYDYAALEPHISARIMQLHHDKHHRAYVTGANRALEMLEEARQAEDFTRIAAMEQALAFNVSGHLLHSIFWENMSPEGGGEPEGELAQAIERDFGSFERFKQQLSNAAESSMGSGWGALVWEPQSERLLTVQIHDHQSQTIHGATPLLVLDAWEHAYYLQYQNVKGDWVTAFWKVVNWEDVAQRFQKVRSLDLGL